MQHIRNFSIIAHIDHGKSTLADRLIQRCGGLAAREMSAQVLDSMDIERERGITIKAQTAALEYKAANGQIYNLNLIDTPGHVDFSYEVSRSLSACEGALLVVDASQGVEAQTVANCYTAIELGVEVLPILNKMDLPQADPDSARAEIEDVIGIDATDAIMASAKTGMGIDEILEAVVARIPPPKGDPEAPLQALIIDSWFDNYVGVVMLLRIVNGVLRPKDKISFMATGAVHLCEQVGVFTPKSLQRPLLSAGEVGFITAGIKELKDAKVGDTITLAGKPAAEPLPGFKEVKPQVFAGLPARSVSAPRCRNRGCETTKTHQRYATSNPPLPTRQSQGINRAIKRRVKCGLIHRLPPSSPAVHRDWAGPRRKRLPLRASRSRFSTSTRKRARKSPRRSAACSARLISPARNRSSPVLPRLAPPTGRSAYASTAR